MPEKTVVIIQARMGSSRLPGKILAPLRGRPMLARQIERIGRMKTKASLVVATTTEAADDAVEEFCRAEGVASFRGSENDVLARYVKAATHYNATEVVRLTGDCPLIDPELIDAVITHRRVGKYDYASNILTRTYPRGMDVEAFTFATLMRIDALATDPGEREHVTLGVYRRPGEFCLGGVAGDSDESGYRLTVDTPDDFRLIAAIYDALYPKNPAFSLRDILALLERRPDLAALNAHISQKSA